LKVNARALTVSGQGIYQIGRITDHELQALAHWIRDQPWCGSLYLNHPNAEEWKALPVESLLGPVEEGRAPLVIVNPTWSPRLNKHGVMGVTQLTVNDGWSTHGNAVPTDMQAFCVGWGPGFKKSYLSDIPAGIVDIAPTICHLHGLGRQGGFDGRALHEALADGDHVPHWTSSVEGRPHQRQPLQTAQVRTTRYILGCEVHRV